MLHRDSGTPSSLGISQAIAFTWTTISGGKSPGSSGPRPVLQACETLLEEPFPPETDDLTASIQAGRDLVVGQPFRRKENHLCPHDKIIR